MCNTDKIRYAFVIICSCVVFAGVVIQIINYEPPEVKEYKYTLTCNEHIVIEDALYIWSSKGGFYSISTREPKNHRNQTYTPEQGQLCEIAKEHI